MDELFYWGKDLTQNLNGSHLISFISRQSITVSFDILWHLMMQQERLLRFTFLSVQLQETEKCLASCHAATFLILYEKK